MPRRPNARSGARYSAPPHCSRPLPAASSHLGPPQRARRGASTSATRHAAGPLLLLPPLAPVRTRHGRPERSNERAHTRASLTPSCLFSLFLWMQSTPADTLDTVQRPPVTRGDGNELAGARVHGGPPSSYK